MQTKHPFLLGTAALTLSSLLCRLLGFFYRIFLSRTIGAEGMGLYQMIAPVFTLCFCLSTSGVTTAMTRQLAAQFALHDTARAHRILKTGLLLTTIPSIFLSFLVYLCAPWIAHRIYGEMSTIILLRLLAAALPFSTMHACINSYYYAKKSTFIPACSQILEQIIRLLVSWICYRCMLRNQIPLSPVIAVAGAAISEISALVFSLICYRFPRFNAPLSLQKRLPAQSDARDLFALSFPITLNRLSLNLLHSLEAVLIPASLRAFGMSDAQALSVFGILTGMALPVLLFPTALIHSFSTLLLPTIAQSDAKGNKLYTLHLIHKAQFCSFFFGILFAFFFLFFGNSLGAALFHNEQSGLFLRTLAFLSPFLYFNITIASILNGLGRTLVNFRINFSCMVIRLASILLFVPSIGIRGYLFGLLTSEIFASVLGLFVLKNSKVTKQGRQVKKIVL